ncbi:glycosyltransferase [Rothia dentocariosa]|uniref:glycosyltransferase n=1 Tax=Rothia dentocariosa TaxID=2047 RepID=UPI0028E93F40|nr:glycosyltransferase [Rothia dentocariosa]
MSIQNVPHTAGHSIILDPASFTLAQAPSRLPADTYDLVISLGTDYHTFDRLLRWVKAYLAENPQLRCLVQHGHTSPVEGADNVKLLPAGTLKRLYAKAQVVLVQGGPGSIQDARATGAIPLVVPRRVEFDEVVDNHQVPFVTMMEKQGGAVIVESRADLFDKLTLAFENPSLFHAAQPYVANPSIAAGQLAQGLDNLLSGRTRRAEGYIARFKQAARAHAAGKQEMARINAITPSE